MYTLAKNPGALYQIEKRWGRQPEAFASYGESNRPEHDSKLLTLKPRTRSVKIMDESDDKDYDDGYWCGYCDPYMYHGQGEPCTCSYFTEVNKRFEMTKRPPILG